MAEKNKKSIKHGFQKPYRKIDPRVVAAAKDYENQVVIPHCSVCSRPCCGLTDVVLELNWQQTKKLYAIELSQKDYNLELKKGRGHSCIKEQQGLYYAYGSPCPAYDLKTRLCNVYQTSTKPGSCSDFPVYVDDDVITADTRCEALKIEDLLRMLRTAAPDLKLSAKADNDFPQLISISQKKN